MFNHVSHDQVTIKKKKNQIIQGSEENYDHHKTFITRDQVKAPPRNDEHRLQRGDTFYPSVLVDVYGYTVMIGFQHNYNVEGSNC